MKQGEEMVGEGVAGGRGGGGRGGETARDKCKGLPRGTARQRRKRVEHWFKQRGDGVGGIRNTAAGILNSIFPAAFVALFDQRLRKSKGVLPPGCDCRELKACLSLGLVSGLELHLSLLLLSQHSQASPQRITADWIQTHTNVALEEQFTIHHLTQWMKTHGVKNAEQEPNCGPVYYQI